jgi:hypothetical protein
MRSENGISRLVIAGILAIIVSVAGYMIIGGLLPSGAPVAEAPVSPPANPQRNF